MIKREASENESEQTISYTSYGLDIKAALLEGRGGAHCLFQDLEPEAKEPATIARAMAWP